MDPYSLSVEKEASKNIEENERECFKDAIVSSRSLNRGFQERKSLKSSAPQIAAAVIAASFHITVGMSMAYSAVLIPQLESNTTDIETTTTETSWMASIVVMSIPVGAVIGGIFNEAVGSLKTIQIASIPSTVGWMVIALATNVPLILFGRFLTGLASAMGTAPAIVYITEIARPELRGSLISTGPTLASAGMLLIYIKGAYLGWRVVAWLSIIYAAIPLVLIQIFTPESPLWLVSKGRLDEAKKSLEWFNKYEIQRGKISVAEEAYNAIMKEHEIKQSEIRRSKNGDGNSKWRAFLKPTGWKPMIILCLFFLVQQFSGIYITLFYAVTWFQETGSDINPYKASIFVGATRLVCSLGNTWLLKRFKRRILCITSALGMAICMAISGYFTLAMKTDKNAAGNWVPVVCLLFYVCTSMLGMLTIPWTMTAELFPTEIRGAANSISYSIANFLMFIAVQSYRGLSDILGGSHGVQWFFAAVSVGAAIFVYVLLPETHGKKLSEIEEYFQNHFLAIGTDKSPKKKSTTKKRNVVVDKAKTNAAIIATAEEPLNPKTKETV